MRIGFAAFVCLALALPLAAQQTEQFSDYEISFGVSGNAGADDSYNPLTVVYKRWPQHATKVLGYINYTRPLTATDIARTNASSS